MGGGPQNGDVELPLRGRGRGPGFGPATSTPRPGRGRDADRERPGEPPAAQRQPVAARRTPSRRHVRGGRRICAAAQPRDGFGVLALLAATALVLVASAQRARRLARQQLEFVTGVTHELNTPLAAIRSAGQNLAAGIVTEPAQVRRYGELIDKEGARLAALVAQVLDFAGIESGGRAYLKEPLSLASRWSRRWCATTRWCSSRRASKLEREVAPDLPELRGDAPRCERAIANLITNAAKFAATGRWIGIRAHRAPARRPRGGAARRGPRPRHPARGARARLRAVLSRPGRGAERDPRQRARAEPGAARRARARRQRPRRAARRRRRGARGRAADPLGGRRRERPDPDRRGRAGAGADALGPAARRGLRGRVGRDRRPGREARARGQLRPRAARRGAAGQERLRRTARPAPAARRRRRS